MAERLFVTPGNLMTGIRSKGVLALAAAAMLLAASPSYAFVAHACTAKDSRGVKYSYEYFGILSFDSKYSAASFAMQACKAKSSRPNSCRITVCIKTHA